MSENQTLVGVDSNSYMEPGLLRGPGVEVERAVPEVWCSSRSGSRSGEGVAVLRSLDDRFSQRTHAENHCFLDVAKG